MNKILRTLCMMSVAAGMTGCWTSIFTVAPVEEPVAPPKTVYSTTVTTPSPKVTTVTTVTVTSYNSDPCFYLDLNAVAAAFAESRTVKEFEELLNSSRYMINNLDLNRDGWVDYLRVLETYKGYYHSLLIQACLAPGVFQDVATLVAERRADLLYVEVIGDRFLYGTNYIVRPVFVKRPPLWDVYGRPTYAVWMSPYVYGSFPSYYKQPKPVYLNHYQAYVTTYMSNHPYCHHCDYPQKPFYDGYVQMTQPHCRNDYYTSHPDQSFESRVTRPMTANGSGVSVRNAGQLRTEVERSSTKATSSTGSTRSTNTSGTSTRNAQTDRSTQTSTSTRSSQNTQTGTSTRSTQTDRSSTTTRQPSTSVESRVNRSGTTRTTIKTTDASGRTTTVKREAAQTRSNSSERTRQATQTNQSNSSERTRQSGSTGTSGNSGTRRR